MLAQHLTVSGRSLDAAALWLQAGLLAKDMGSTIEALARLDRCLRCLELTDASPEGLAIRMRCQMVRGAVINAHFGPVEPSAQEALSEAVTLATALQDGEAMVDSLTSLSIVKYYAGDFSAAISVAKQMIDYGTEHNNERASTAGKVFAGMCHFATGQFQQARADFEEALALLGGGKERAEPAEVRALVYLANTLHILGKFGEAAQLSAVALELTRHRRALDHAVALGNSLYLYYMQGSLEQTRRAGTELAHLGAEKGLLMWYHHARFFLGWADAVDGDRAGLEMMEASMDRFRSAHELVEQTLFYGILAERYLAAGVRERALENVERGLALVNRLGERFFEAPLVRIKMKCLTGFSDAKTVTELAELSIRAEQLAKDNGALAWFRKESA